ncbi:MAG: L-serine ammonia-lyase, iron-sulfur-dependent subunit beta [Actinomycetes bacterium]|jgi:L-serine dehydratase|nr:L-serine ammonia-lyase, iron-sulfur-dependent subunit beta [Actinomycetes bacterium]
MTLARSIFEIIGPVMVGPSSSHTAGAVRLAALARAIFGRQPDVATVKLHGSFAATGDGHGTKLALTAGLLGLTCDDARIPDAFELAKSAGLRVLFEEITLDGAHPNTAVFVLEDIGTGAVMTMEGYSPGGGAVRICELDGYEVDIDGELPLLVVAHVDRQGVIHAVSEVLTDAGVNIAAMKVSREHRGAKALMLISCDVMPAPGTVARIAQLPHIRAARAVPALSN